MSRAFSVCFFLFLSFFISFCHPLFVAPRICFRRAMAVFFCNAISTVPREFHFVHHAVYVGLWLIDVEISVVWGLHQGVSSLICSWYTNIFVWVFYFKWFYFTLGYNLCFCVCVCALRHTLHDHTKCFFHMKPTYICTIFRCRYMRRTGYIAEIR